MRFAIFPLHLSKVLRLPRKSEARSYEVLHMSRKIIFPKPKSAPGPPNISDEHVSCTVPAMEDVSLQILFKCPTPASFLDMLQNRHLLLTLDMQWCTMPCACHAQRHLNVQKWSEHVLLHFDLEMRFHHNGVHFFDISTPKSDPTLRCFAHFDLEMCFAPRRRALFRHRNFQKWSDVGVFCTFWLGNVLRATTACNFSSLIWPHGSAPAALASLLFEPPDPQIIGKTPCFATFLPFRAPGSSFFWDFYFFDLLSSFLFPLSSFFFLLSSFFFFLLSSFVFLLSSFFFLLSSFLLSSLLWLDSSHLCFSSVHIVGSLTSKLPLGTVYSIIIIYIFFLWLCIYSGFRLPWSFSAHIFTIFHTGIEPRSDADPVVLCTRPLGCCQPGISMYFYGRGLFPTLVFDDNRGILPM